MIAQFFTLAARVHVHQLVAVLLCCCCMGRGHLGVRAVLPLAPVSEAAESEQAPVESTPTVGEAAWAAPRCREGRQFRMHFVGNMGRIADIASHVRPWLRQSPGNAGAGRFEHAWRAGLGAPLRI